MANYRVITGQFNKFLTDEPYKYGEVNIRLKQNDYTLSAGFPAYNQTVGLDATGALPVGLELWCNGDGLVSAEYEVTEPDGTKWSFFLNYDDGSPISLQSLRAGGQVPDSPETVNTLIVNEIEAKTIRYDQPQNLTPQEQLQAQENAGFTGGAGEPTIAPGTTADYWRGDKTWQTLNKAAVGLSNVDNTADSGKPVSTAQQTALDAKVGKASGAPTEVNLLWSGSQAQYDAISSKDANTIYFIV